MRDYLTVDYGLPDIAGTYALILAYRPVPLDLRLDYSWKRSRALSLHGLAGWDDAKAEALNALEAVRGALCAA